MSKPERGAISLRRRSRQQPSRRREGGEQRLPRESEKERESERERRKGIHIRAENQGKAKGKPLRPP